jgi:azurin
MKKTFFLFTITGILLSSCGNNHNGHEHAATGSPTTSQLSTDGIILLNAGDDMRFDQTEIRVREGQTIELTLRHTGKFPKSSMGHNFVLLKSDASVETFANNALAAKETDYVPAGNSDVITHTRLIGGGESDVIKFPAPAKGSYPFLCSFPGHAGIMRGNLIVE